MANREERIEGQLAVIQMAVDRIPYESSDSYKKQLERLHKLVYSKDLELSELEVNNFYAEIVRAYGHL